MASVVLDNGSFAGSVNQNVLVAAGVKLGGAGLATSGNVVVGGTVDVNSGRVSVAGDNGTDPLYGVANIDVGTQQPRGTDYATSIGQWAGPNFYEFWGDANGTIATPSAPPGSLSLWGANPLAPNGAINLMTWAMPTGTAPDPAPTPANTRLRIYTPMDVLSSDLLVTGINTDDPSQAVSNLSLGQSQPIGTVYASSMGQYSGTNFFELWGDANGTSSLPSAPAGSLSVWGTTAGGVSVNFLSYNLNPTTGAATISVNEDMNFSNAAQRGAATILLGTNTAVVSNPLITASSIVMVTGRGVPDATATSFSVTNNGGVGFTIVSNANATANTDVMWFLVSL